MNPKNILKKYFIFLLIAIFFIMVAGQTKAAVPVVVFGDYLNHVRNVDNVDDLIDPNVGDIESFIHGYFEPDILSANDTQQADATVTRTQKLKGTVEDYNNIINEVLKSINLRLCENYTVDPNQLENCLRNCKDNNNCGTCDILKPQSCDYKCKNIIVSCPAPTQDLACSGGDCTIKCETKFKCATSYTDPNKQKACVQEKNLCINDCEKVANDLRNIRIPEVCAIKNDLTTSIALDVHMVKDSTQLVDDLQSIAKEELGREQFAEIADKFNQEYETAGIIEDFNDYLYKDSWDFGAAYLSNYFFPQLNSSFTAEEQDAMVRSILSESLGRFNTPRNTLNPVDHIEDVLDEKKGGSWNDFLAALQPNNNPFAIYLTARDEFEQVKNAKYDENKTQAIAYQGVLPLSQKLTTGEINLNGTPKSTIVKPGSLIGGDQTAIAEQLLGLAASPQYAPAGSAKGAPGKSLPSPTMDSIAGKDAIVNIRWYDDVVENTKWEIYDAFNHCLPDACALLTSGDLIAFFERTISCIANTLPDMDYNLRMPDVAFCGINICSIIYIPILCDF